MGVYRKNETWWVDFYYQGKRFRQKIGTKKKSAEEALNQIKVKIASGDFVPIEERKHEELFGPQPVLFEIFASEDLLPWSKVEHSANHSNQFRITLNAHLIPYFKGLYLHQITPKRIEDYKVMRSKKVNPASVNREIFFLKTLFRKAVEWTKLGENPVDKVKTLKETPQTPRLLEVEEVVRLLEACREEPSPVDLYALVCCMVYAGLRKAEVFNLRWEGIDRKREELTVESRPEWQTKNYESRSIPMNETLTEALRPLPRRFGCSLVFPYTQRNRLQEHKPYTSRFRPCR